MVNHILSGGSSADEIYGVWASGRYNKTLDERFAKYNKIGGLD